MFRRVNTKISSKFHPQHVIDCLNPKNIAPDECYTSSPRKAFEWIISNQGIGKEKDYKFNAKRGNWKIINLMLREEIAKKSYDFF